jgi:hypothetical protein
MAVGALLMLLFVSGALAQTRDYYLHWAPSPIIDDEGIVRPEAVEYEVWYQRGSDSEVMVSTVNDTTFILAVDPGIMQRIRVRAVDIEGRKSAMSEWSDPIYFELEQNNNSLVPPVAELRANYPNPFNPETRIVYGVPEGLSSGDRVRMDIYSVSGQRVRTLEVDRSPGWHEVVWDGRDDSGLVAATGMYVTRFSAGSSVKTGKMTMVK